MTSSMLRTCLLLAVLPTRLPLPDRFEAELVPFVEALVANWGVPGLAVGVVRDDEVVFARAFGVANVESGTPLTTSTLFHMASVSKTFVATAVLQLAERGEIGLDDPVVRHLDYFRLDDDRLPGVTVRRMLEHTSGMPDTSEYGWNHPELDDGALERYVRGLADLSLEFDPGTRWSYSNIAYEVLGELVARASGETFEACLKHRVLDPLAMHASTFLLAETDPAQRATGHVWDLVPAVAPVHPYNRAHAPSSTLHSNVEEMCIWLRAHLARGHVGGTRILEEATYDEMWRAGPETDVYGMRMGLGWFRGERRGMETWCHPGGDTGFNAWIELVPEASVGVVVLGNANWGPAVRLVAEAAIDVALGHAAGRVRTPIHYVFGRTLEARGVGAAIQEYLELRDGGARDFAFSADSLNAVGDALLERGRTAEAREVFALCADEYPEDVQAREALGRLRDEGVAARTGAGGGFLAFDRANDQVNVPIIIDGSGPFWFIIDTGASGGGCIDRALAAELALPIVDQVEVGDGSGRGNVLLPVAAVERVVVGGADLGRLELVIGDFRRPMEGERVRLGILGLGAFARHALAIDYPRGTVELRAGPMLEGETTHDTELPPLEVGEVVVTLRIGQLELPAVVDTGSSSGFNLPLEVLDQVLTLGPPEVVGRGHTRTNSYDILSAVLSDRLTFAGHGYESARVRLNDHHGVAIVGYEVLRDLRVTLDPFRRRARFERSPADPRPDGED